MRGNAPGVTKWLPREVQLSGDPDNTTEVLPMTTRPRDAARLHTFTLVRVSPDAEERVSTHPTFEEGWAAGQSAVHADEQAAFSLYAPSGECKARTTTRPCRRACW